MAVFSIHSHYLPCFYLILFVSSSIANPLDLLSKVDSKDTISNSFNLFGDAQLSNGSSTIQLTRPIATSSGLVVYRKPFRFTDPGSVRGGPTSFSADFTFSISPHNGGGLAFLIVPTDFPMKFSGKNSCGLSGVEHFLGIEFDTSMDGNVDDENSSHDGVDVSSLISVKMRNLSSTNLVLNSGSKMRSWVDYDGSSKRLEVRLSNFGDRRPYNPLLAYEIDLSEMWKTEEVLVGISSSSGNDKQTCSLYSWKLGVRSVPTWLHSQPVNPKDFTSIHGDQLAEQKKKTCSLRFLSGLMFVTGCGALVAFLVLFFWAVFVGNNIVFSSEKSALPVNFRYEKVNVIVDHTSGDVKN